MTTPTKKVILVTQRLARRISTRSPRKASKPAKRRRKGGTSVAVALRRARLYGRNEARIRRDMASLRERVEADIELTREDRRAILSAIDQTLRSIETRYRYTPVFYHRGRRVSAARAARLKGVVVREYWRDSRGRFVSRETVRRSESMRRYHLLVGRIAAQYHIGYSEARGVYRALREQGYDSGEISRSLSPEWVRRGSR